jgi:signal peptidase I
MARAADQEPETATGADGPATPGPGEPQEPQDPAQPDDPAGKPARKRRPARVVTEWVAIVAVALVLALAARQWVFQTFSIPSESMVPTLDIGDRIVVQKIFWSWHDIKQGDIVVFSRPPHDTQCTGPESEDLVKRVIALPGQTIYSAFGKVFVDGRQLHESYLPKPDPLGRPIPGASAQHPYHVPAGDFYVMGDNRAVSCDSRYWGPVKGSTIVGKVVLLLWRHGHPAWHVF